jgi:hypothetical protein
MPVINLCKVFAQIFIHQWRLNGLNFKDSPPKDMQPAILYDSILGDCTLKLLSRTIWHT